MNYLGVHRSTPWAAFRIRKNPTTVISYAKPVNRKMGLLKFKVVAASGLKKADTFGKSDPYCVVFSGEARVGKTTVQKKTLDPEWNADFELIFEENEEGEINTNSEALRFEIFDKDLIGAHDFLGMYELSGETLLEFVASKTETPKLYRCLRKMAVRSRQYNISFHVLCKGRANQQRRIQRQKKRNSNANHTGR